MKKALPCLPPVCSAVRTKLCQNPLAVLIPQLAMTRSGTIAKQAGARLVLQWFLTEIES